MIICSSRSIFISSRPFTMPMMIERKESECGMREGRQMHRREEREKADRQIDRQIDKQIQADRQKKR